QTETWLSLYATGGHWGKESRSAVSRARWRARRCGPPRPVLPAGTGGPEVRIAAAKLQADGRDARSVSATGGAATPPTACGAPAPAGWCPPAPGRAAGTARPSAAAPAPDWPPDAARPAARSAPGTAPLRAAR